VLDVIADRPRIPGSAWDVVADVYLAVNASGTSGHGPHSNLDLAWIDL